MGDLEVLRDLTNEHPVDDSPSTSQEHAPKSNGGPQGSEGSCERTVLVVCGESRDMRRVDGIKLGEHTSVVTNEAYPLPKGNSDEDPSHTSPLSPSAVLPPLSPPSSAVVLWAESSSSQGSAHPRKAEKILPLEIWTRILSQLDRNEKVANTRTCRLFGDIVEDELYRHVELDMHTVLSWTAGVSRYTHRSNTMRTLEISLEGASKDFLREMVPHLRKALSGLPALREFSLLDVQDLPPNAAEDIFEGAEFSLIKLACDSDDIIVRSWKSLKKQTQLEEFRALLDYTLVLRPDMTPDVFPKLRLLDTSTPFAVRVTSASAIRNLSIWMAYHEVRPALARITQTLGGNLSSLKVTRHIMKFPSPYFGITFAPQGWQPSRHWELHSPIAVCEVLRAPNLVYLEINDVCYDTERREWRRTRLVEEEPARFAQLSTKLQTECVPSLTTLVWWPAWADSVATMYCSVSNYVAEFFALLPITSIVLPPLISWDREGEEGGWTSVERDQVNHGGTLPQQWNDLTNFLLHERWVDVSGPFRSRWEE